MGIRRLPYLSLAVIVILIIFTCGCVSETTQQNSERAGLSSDGESEHLYPISYQEGISKIGDVLGPASGGGQNFPVYFIQAKRIDSEGKALQWIFGITKDNQNIFVLVESDRQILIPWFSGLPEQEINFNSIIEPGKLLEMNWNLIKNVGDKEPIILPELEISNGIYTITVPTDKGNTVLYFDGGTGKPLVPV